MLDRRGTNGFRVVLLACKIRVARIGDDVSFASLVVIMNEAWGANDHRQRLLPAAAAALAVDARRKAVAERIESIMKIRGAVNAGGGG